MALFDDLHDVAQVLVDHIAVSLGFSEVQAGLPRPVTASTTPAVRVTLLYMTPQGTHRNDPPERQPSGRIRRPPPTLSCYYLVTTSGADGDDPIAAHAALGRIILLFHENPVLSLPLAGTLSPASALSDRGEGPLSIVQVPIVLDQLDKIWSNFEVKLQPWVLYEVGPVQLRSEGEDAPGPRLVLPGGVEVAEVRAGRRPQVLRASPEPVRPGGRVRLDLATGGAVEQVHVAGVQVRVGDPAIIQPQPSAPLLLDLSAATLAGVGTGNHALSVLAAGVVSLPSVLRVAAAEAPTIDAPLVTRHDPMVNLGLTGQNLAGAVSAIVWPDGGTVSASDFHRVGVGSQTAGSVEVLSVGSPGGLRDINFGSRLWRLAIEAAPNVYTGSILMVFGP